MKRLLLLLMLLAPLSASATTTVTGQLNNLGTGAVGSGAFARFYLRGCGGNQPRVNGTAVIAPTLGGVFYFDIVANSSGVISGTLYSTRDATGLLGGDIQCGTSSTSVWYGLVVFVSGKGGPEMPIHAKNGATLNLNSVTPISTTPVVAAPTGDGTYLRLDAGNSPETGNVAFTGNNTHSGSETFSGGITANSTITSNNGITLNGAGAVFSGNTATFNSGAIFNGTGATVNALLNTNGITPNAAATYSIGTVANPYLSLIIGGATNTTTAQTSAATANRSVIWPDAGGTPSLAAIEYCGATSGASQPCAKTVQTLPIMVWGDVLLNAATTQSITTLPFTDALYSCSGSDLTTAAGVVSFNTYAAASVTIQESGGANTDHLRWLCIGH